MYRLQDILSTVQQTAEAIAEVLKIEVEIADANLVRVAGTGSFRGQCGCKMGEGYIYRYVLETGRPLVIENPGGHPLCQPCPQRGQCVEDAEVVSPVIAEGETIGIVGLISFSPEQTARLLDNRQSLLRFLDKMAELIAGKVIEQARSRERETFAKQISTVVNLLEDGILVVDSQKVVTHSNSLACSLLQMSEIAGRRLDDLIEIDAFWPLVSRGELFSGQVHAKRVPLLMLCKAIPFHRQGGEGAVIQFRDIQQIRQLVRDVTVPDVETRFSEIMGNSLKIVEAKEMAARIARGNSTVLIRGESGTGKEIFARAIHQASERRKQPFIALNCAAIPENLLESELFGYEDGAFTGAKKGGKLGKFELAHHGTIFLDEIGDMPLHLQVKLLRVLQERRVERIGSTRSIPVDVRVITATHRDLEQLVSTGEYREDLYYRLNVIPLWIPPLRGRKEDIPLLVRHFADHYCRLLDKTEIRFSAGVHFAFNQYAWPGNVRELANIIEYCVTMAVGGEVTEVMLPPRITEHMLNLKQDSTPRLNLQDIERETVVKALQYVGNDAKGKDMAAKLLGISRATLYRKIQEYKISEKTLYI